MLYEQIKQASELFKIKMVTSDRCEGLLYPIPGCNVFAYNEAALGVYGEVRYHEQQKAWLFQASIHGIDDGNLYFHAKYMDEEQARRLLKTFYEWIAGMYFQCPLPETVMTFCRQHQLTPDYS